MAEITKRDVFQGEGIFRALVGRYIQFGMISVIGPKAAVIIGDFTQAELEADLAFMI